MKKILKVLTSLLLCTTLVSCYGGDYQQDGFYYAGSTIIRNAFIGPGDYDNVGIINNEITINIPDEFEGYKIEALGGYMGRGYPMPFMIDYRDAPHYLFGVSEDMLNEDIYAPFLDVMEELKVNINIGKNIKETELVLFNEIILFGERDEDYNIVSYEKAIRPKVYITVSEDNKTFYSKQGKMYYKEDDTLVDCFLYE